MSVSTLLKQARNAAEAQGVELSVSQHAGDGVMLPVSEDAVRRADSAAAVAECAALVKAMSEGEKLLWVRQQRSAAAAEFRAGRHAASREVLLQSLVGVSPGQKALRAAILRDMASCSLQLRELEKAATLGQKAIEIDPACASALVVIAEARCDQDRLGEST
jgi:hypothetical protein